MKILFISHYFPPEGNAPATRVHAMCKRWVEAGHEVTVITGAPNVPNGVVYDGYKNKLSHHEQIDGIEVRRVWTYIAANRGRVRRVLNYLSFMVAAVIQAMWMKRPDVVVATSPQFFCGWAGAIVSRLRCLPFVLEIRDLWPESIRAVGVIRNNKVLGLLEWVERRLYAEANRVVTVGPGYERLLRQRGVRNPVVITNGIDSKQLFPEAPDQQIVGALGLEGKYVCGYVGTIGMAAGLEVVLDAAERLKTAALNDIAFLFVGDGAERESLEAEATRRGLDNVVFTGRVAKESIRRFQSVCHCNLVHLRSNPLFETVLPSKLFEAMAMAHPIILGVRGSAAQVVHDARAGIAIEPEDAGALAIAVERLASDANQGRRMGDAGHAYVLANYNLDVLAQEYQHLLEDLTSDKAVVGTIGLSDPEVLDWYVSHTPRVAVVPLMDLKKRKSA